MSTHIVPYLFAKFNQYLTNTLSEFYRKADCTLSASPQNAIMYTLSRVAFRLKAVGITILVALSANAETGLKAQIDFAWATGDIFRQR